MITAGSEDLTYDSANPNFATDGPKEYAVDGDESTAWCADWNDYGANLANAWLDLQFPEPHTVDGFRYLPTQSSYKWDGGTHEISKYEIWVKTADSEEYQLAASGEWEQNRLWKYVSFEPIENVTNVKIQARQTGDGSNNWFAEAAEIRAVSVVEAKNKIKSESLNK